MTRDAMKKKKKKTECLKARLDWDSFATFSRLCSDADAQVRKRWYSFASTQAIQQCCVRRADTA